MPEAGPGLTVDGGIRPGRTLAQPMSRSPDAPDVASRADLEALPKAELHLHLRGAMPLSYLRKKFRKYPPGRAIESARPRLRDRMLSQPGIRRILSSANPSREAHRLFAYSSFDGFLASYLFTGYFVREAEDLRELVSTVRQTLREQHVTYAEITVSVPEYIMHGIPLDEIMAVLAEESDGSPTVRWIVDLVRDFGPDACEDLLERVLALRPPSLVGLTLGGGEHLHPPAPFRRVYEIAREGGLRTTVHAGEALGPESVWDAVRILEVERIGHGVRAVEDPSLVRFLAERRIPLEVCPTSNVRTGIYASIEAHPVRMLFEAGVPLSISTDDPSFFGVSLAEELVGLRRVGFSWSEIGDLAHGAFGMAFDPLAAAAQDP